MLPSEILAEPDPILDPDDVGHVAKPDRSPSAEVRRVEVVRDPHVAMGIVGDVIRLRMLDEQIEIVLVFING